jgi:hypothetical protein
MKPTESFKNTIKKHLEDRAATDPLFATRYNNPKKNIKDCITYILSTVQKSGCNGFTDDEVYSMAIHFYDEENIEIGKLPENISIVVNHHVELTQEEKDEARKAALQKAQNEAYAAMTKKTVKPKKETENIQPSLFD